MSLPTDSESMSMSLLSNRDFDSVHQHNTTNGLPASAPEYAQSASAAYSNHVRSDDDPLIITPSNALLRLQSFVDAGYELETAVKLANASSSTVPAPPAKSRTREELIAAVNQTYKSVLANGFALNRAGASHTSSNRVDDATGPASLTEFATNDGSRVLVEVRQSGPRCTYRQCNNVAYTCCEYTGGGCGEGPCEILVCVLHGKKRTIGHSLRTVCPEHAVETCAIL